MKPEKRAERSGKARCRKLDSLLLKPPDDLYVDNRSVYSDDGVNLTMIQWFLSLTPAERLEALQQNIRSIEKMRKARRRRRNKKLHQRIQRKRNKKPAVGKSRRTLTSH